MEAEGTDEPTRRRFLLMAPVVLLAWPSRLRGAGTAHPEHPEPRPDIDASKVLKAGKLQNPAAAPVYDMVREVPHLVDGIRCYCGCAEIPGYYSLLTCFEEGGMAQLCDMCQGEARTVHATWKAGGTLADARAAVDARYGG